MVLFWGWRIVAMSIRQPEKPQERWLMFFRVDHGYVAFRLAASYRMS